MTMRFDEQLRFGGNQINFAGEVRDVHFHVNTREVGMDWNKVLDLLKPMREVMNDLEGAALDDAQLSAKTLLDLAGKLTAVDLAIMELYNRELIAEGDRLEAERAELMGVDADADALYDDMGKRLEAAGLEGLQDHARRQYEEWKEKGGEEIAE